MSSTNGTNIRLEKMPLRSRDGHIFSAETVIPETPNGAGMIVIHEAMGVNRGIVEVAQFYAQLGYRVLVPHLYDRLQRDLVLDYHSSLELRLDTIARCGFSLPLLDIDACISALHTEQIQRVGIVGFCYGGTLSWLAASQLSRLNAAVIYYGSAIPHFPEAHPHCPSIAHWGLQDALIDQSAIAAIANAHPKVEMYFYDAGHAFNAHDRPDVYHRTSAEQARQRNVAFLANTLLA